MTDSTHRAVVDPVRWTRIDELFARAVELRESERAGFLAGQCDDDSIRREVLSLLASGVDAPSSIRLIVADAMERARDASTAPHRGDAPVRALGDIVDKRFELCELAGRGGFGTVYRALDLRTGGEVALKVFDAASTQFSRFEREAAMLAALSHRRVVGYLGHGRTDDDSPFLVMEWLDGCDLASVLRRGPLGEQQTLALGLRVAEGLASAHAMGIIHRDIKPSNVFLVDGRSEGVKVIDFGLARRVVPTTMLTTSGGVLGTPAYMAPEQASGTRLLTPGVDVFALGCVLFECLAGEPAFAADNQYALLAKILSGEVPRLGARRPQTSAALDALLAQMMAVEPSDRFPDAVTAALAISAVLSGQARPGTVSGAPAVSRRTAYTHALLLVESDDAFDAVALESRSERFGGIVRCVGDRAVLVEVRLESVSKSVKRTAELALDLLTLPSPVRAAIVTSRSDAPAVTLEEVRAMVGTMLRAGHILLSATAAAIIGNALELVARDGNLWLVGRHARPQPAKLVGRARELAILDGAYAECSEEQRAQIVLVLGEAGLGKTSLIRAALRRFASTFEAPTVVIAQADRPTSTSPFSLLRQFVRDRWPLSERTPAELRARFDAYGMSPLDAVFLCELAGFEVDDPALGAARRDPLVMADAIRCAWLAFIDFELRTRPLVLVLEDLHLADAASVRLLEVAAQQFADRSLLVLASVRPDEAVHQLALLAPCQPERLELHPLRPALAATLVRTLVDETEVERIDQIVSSASGNPLRLEELASIERGSSWTGIGSEPFDARIARLDRGTQRVLRAASVFGLRFEVSGVAELLGGERYTAEVETGLRAACAQRVVHEVAAPAFAFSHAVFQEAAYHLLPAADRARAHGAAAAWLARGPGVDQSIVAWHHEGAGSHAEAFECYFVAARSAYLGGALPRARELAEKALTGAPRDEMAQVLLLQARIAFARATPTSRWQPRNARCMPRGAEVSRGSRRLAHDHGAGQKGENDRSPTIAREVRDQPASRIVRAAHDLLVSCRQPADCRGPARSCTNVGDGGLGASVSGPIRPSLDRERCSRVCRRGSRLRSRDRGIPCRGTPAHRRRRPPLGVPDAQPQGVDLRVRGRLRGGGRGARCRRAPGAEDRRGLRRPLGAVHPRQDRRAGG